MRGSGRSPSNWFHGGSVCEEVSSGTRAQLGLNRPTTQHRQVRTCGFVAPPASSSSEELGQAFAPSTGGASGRVARSDSSGLLCAAAAQLQPSPAPSLKPIVFGCRQAGQARGLPMAPPSAVYQECGVPTCWLYAGCQHWGNSGPWSASELHGLISGIVPLKPESTVMVHQSAQRGLEEVHSVEVPWCAPSRPLHRARSLPSVRRRKPWCSTPSPNAAPFSQHSSFHGTGHQTRRSPGGEPPAVPGRLHHPSFNGRHDLPTALNQPSSPLLAKHRSGSPRRASSCRLAFRLARSPRVLAWEAVASSFMVNLVEPATPAAG